MTHPDLDPIFERAREPIPPGLADRVLQGLGDEALARRFRAADRADAAAAAIRLSLVPFLVAALLLLAILLRGERSSTAPAAPPTIDEEIVALAASSRADPLWPEEGK
jgi:hypothetical protein